MAKQKVALECLSYHATATAEDTSRLVQSTIPSAETYNLYRWISLRINKIKIYRFASKISTRSFYSFKFIDFDLTDDDTCKAAIRMFLECNLVQKFQIPYQVSILDG